MFKGAYRDEFYRLIRDALHLEVESWRNKPENAAQANALWSEIERLEPLSRNEDATALAPPISTAATRVSFLPLDQLSMGAGD